MVALEVSSGSCLSSLPGLACVLGLFLSSVLGTRNSFLGWDVRLTYFEALALIENGERGAFTLSMAVVRSF